jgi:hypothetical protein
MPTLPAVGSRSSLRPSASIPGRVSHEAAADLGHAAAGPGASPATPAEPASPRADAASAPHGRRLRSEGWRQPGPPSPGGSARSVSQTGPPAPAGPSGSRQPDPMDDQAIVAGQVVPAPGGSAEGGASVPSAEAPAETRRLPIFDAVESHLSSSSREVPGSPAAAATTRSGWPSPADEGWRAADSRIAARGRSDVSRATQAAAGR